MGSAVCLECVEFFSGCELWLPVCVLGAECAFGGGLASVLAGLACVCMLVPVRNYVG